MYHLIFVVKIKNNMRVCIIGSGLSALTLAKALVNQNIYVDIFSFVKALAKVMLDNPSPIIQTLILFLILTTKIR